MTVDHPAQWDPKILDRMPELVHRWLPLPIDEPVRVLDPYGGVGGIHHLHRTLAWDTISVEREPVFVERGQEAWPGQAGRMLHGDASAVRMLLRPTDQPFDAIITSPTWGNRVADRYMGGSDEAAGRAPSKKSRRTYAISLGHPPSEGSTAGFQWGDEYKRLHVQHMARWVEVLAEHAVVIVDIADHTRDLHRQRVVNWWSNRLNEMVGQVEERIAVSARRYGYGQNAGDRWPEILLVAVKQPTTRPRSN